MVSDFKKTVKHRLVDLDKTQEWLMQEIRKRTASKGKPDGMFIDSSYLQKILNGQRKGKKIVPVICEILDIEEGK